MQKGKIDNSTLDEIGQALVRQAFEKPADIETVVASPHLFARIKARIQAEDHKAVSTLSFAHSMTFGMRITGIVAGAAILAAAATGLFLMRFDSADKLAAYKEVQVPATLAEVARPPLDPPQVVSLGKLRDGRATNLTQARDVRPVAIRSMARRTVPVETTMVESDDGFYPVAYAGDLEESAAGGHVIRVDMSRSSLFALGINLPLENDEETVRADLLIGRDGATRAVRLVK